MLYANLVLWLGKVTALQATAAILTAILGDTSSTPAELCGCVGGPKPGLKAAISKTYLATVAKHLWATLLIISTAAQNTLILVFLQLSNVDTASMCKKGWRQQVAKGFA